MEKKNSSFLIVTAAISVVLVFGILIAGCAVRKTGRAYTPGADATIGDFVSNIQLDPTGYALVFPDSKYVTNSEIVLASQLASGLGLKELSASEVTTENRLIVVGNEQGYNDAAFSTIMGGVFESSALPENGAVVGTYVSADSSYVILYVIGKTPVDTINALTVLANSMSDSETLKALQYKKVIVTGTTAADVKLWEGKAIVQTPVQTPTQTETQAPTQIPTQTSTLPAQICKSEAGKVTDSTAGEFIDRCADKTIYRYSCDSATNKYNAAKEECKFGCDSLALKCKKVDLVVESITTAPETLIANTPFEVIVKIKNNGDGAIEKGVLLTISIMDENNESSSKTFTYASFTAGESKTETMQVADAKLTSSGQKTVKATLTANELSAEEDAKANNEMTKTVEVPACVPKIVCYNAEGAAIDDSTKWDTFWSKCDASGNQVRKCEDAKQCGGNTVLPSTTQKCCNVLQSTSECDAATNTLKKTFTGGSGACEQAIEKCDYTKTQVTYTIKSNAIGAKIFVDDKDTGLTITKEGSTVLTSPGAVHIVKLLSEEYSGTASKDVGAKNAGDTETINIRLKQKASKLISNVKTIKNADKYLIVIGDSVEDNLASITFAGSTGVGVTKVHNDASLDICKNNMIIIGGACANRFAGDLLGKKWVDGKPAADCYATADTLGIGAGKVGSALIKVFDQNELTAIGCKDSENTILVIAGSDALDTRRAARAVSKYLANTAAYDAHFKSDDFKVCGYGLEDGLDKACGDVANKCANNIEYGKCGQPGASDAVSASSALMYCGPDKDHPGRKKVQVCTKDQVCNDGEGCIAAAHLTASIDRIYYITSKGLEKDAYTTEAQSRFPSPETVLYFSGKTSGGDSSTYKFSWDFGDGEKSSEQSPKHAYKREGTYNIKMSVNDGAAVATAKLEIVQ